MRDVRATRVRGPQAGRLTRKGCFTPPARPRDTPDAPAPYIACATGDLRRVCHSSIRKNGPPISPVRMPTGSTVPASRSIARRRDAASASASSPAPVAVATGRSLRWSWPTMSRARCGPTSPMNPIGPLTATADAVMSDATTSAAQRSRWIRTPSASASASLSTAALSWPDTYASTPHPAPPPPPRGGRPTPAPPPPPPPRTAPRRREALPLREILRDDAEEDRAPAPRPAGHVFCEGVDEEVDRAVDGVDDDADEQEG